MKKIFFFTIVIFFSFKITAQVNLVSNPSFELYDTCPNNSGQIHYATDWFQPYAWYGNIYSFSSSEYYNSCTSNWSVSTPINLAGNQSGNSGVAYAGIICYTASGVDYREYVEAKLTGPLLKNKKYCVEFYTSLAESSKFAIDAFGVYFSSDSLINDHTTGSSVPYLLAQTPQIENYSGNIITDSIGWLKISNTFISNGGEQFITIGNFRNNLLTNIQLSSGTASWAYYYIDDISVVLCDDSEPFIPNIFTPNNDGENDNLTIYNLSANGNIKIYNRWGIKVFETSNQNDFWDGKTASGLDCVEGTYYYIISTNERVYKGFLQLVR